MSTLLVILTAVSITCIAALVVAAIATYAICLLAALIFVVFAVPYWAVREAIMVRRRKRAFADRVRLAS